MGLTQDDVTRVLAIRHGETAWNVEARIQGHIDIDLNDRGRWQAQRVAAALSDEPISAIYSSDLLRAYNTAAAIAPEFDTSPLFFAISGSTPYTNQWLRSAFRLLRVV